MRSVIKSIFRRWIYGVGAAAFVGLGFWLGHGHSEAPLAAQQVQPASGTASAQPQVDNRRAVAYMYDAQARTNVPITREEFGEYFISLFGPDQVDSFVNRRIIEKYCEKRGIDVTRQEIDAQINEDCQKVGVNRADFVKTVLRQRYGKTLEEWRVDVIKPRLMMAKLCRGQIQVSDQELQQIYENRYGKKVQCKIIIWPYDTVRPESKQIAERKAMQSYGQLLKGDKEFDAVATTQQDSVLASKAGAIEPIGRFSAVKDDKVEKLAFGMEVGQVSALQDLTGIGWAVLKCVGHIPPATNVDFNKERPALMKEMIERKLEDEIPKLCALILKEAQPMFILKPRREHTPQQIEQDTGISIPSKQSAPVQAPGVPAPSR
jgi:hypothetical protein